MNVIYTYKKLPHFKPMDDIFFTMARISVESANRFHKTILYCDSDSKELFEENNIPFNEIVVLDSLESYKGIWYTVPKMITMKSQSDPYLHLDLDTIIFSKIELSKSVTFGHGDLIFQTNEEALNHDYIKDNYLTQLKTVFKRDISDSDFTRIPNFCFVGVTNPQIVSDTINNLLGDYEELANISEELFKEKYTPHTGGVPSTFDQFLFYDYFRKVSNDYGFITEKPEIDMNTENYKNYGIINEYGDMSQFLNYKFCHLQNYRELLIDSNFLSKLEQMLSY